MKYTFFIIRHHATPYYSTRKDINARGLQKKEHADGPIPAAAREGRPSSLATEYQDHLDLTDLRYYSMMISLPCW